jgi:hypothetical protein
MAVKINAKYNPDFKPLEFEGFMNEAGANAFTLSPQNTPSEMNIIQRHILWKVWERCGRKRAESPTYHSVWQRHTMRIPHEFQALKRRYKKRILNLKSGTQK